MEGMKLLDVINAVKPTILIGLSGCGGIFNGKILLCFVNSDWKCHTPKILVV
jgi:hypothetical protein